MTPKNKDYIMDNPELNAEISNNNQNVGMVRLIYKVPISFVVLLLIIVGGLITIFGYTR